MISKPGRTRGIEHKCFRFTLIENPIAFAARRDAARVAKMTQVEAVASALADDVQPRRLELQKALVLGHITREEYNVAIREIEAEIDRGARGNLPRSVKLRQFGTQRGKHRLKPAVNQ